MTDNLDGVATFVQVVEAGSFALAAERMNLTRSAVGKAISRLEARLGVRLLHRSTRSQTLTAEGQAYYEGCVRALAELDVAEAALDHGRAEPAGRLRVSVPEAFGYFCVAPILLDLVRQYPKLQIDLSFTDRFTDLIEEGFDLAVRIGELRDSSTLAARRLGTQHVVIGASPAYLERYGTPTCIEQLENHVGIALSRAGAVAPWNAKDADGSAQPVRIRSRVSMDDIQAIAAAAIDGYGLAWLPCWLLTRYAKSGALVPVLDNYRVRSQEVYAIWPKARHLRAKTRVAIDALKEKVPEMIGE
ncbi:LysR family transcriptional regulator [Paraburkholderia sp. Ac-20342]|uniref:LysR family transcriptional regulator n=1 Tax=Paraburkholderia sp. Ac-20342 TaxID=2703889 RepID=UPI00197E5A1B|nr:LysR family transcriptional regulator [Paraburkholderia sp. Ac-20342]MBN3846349.1 LysR family transcriptional regulator [Paraburkholderia sp. Ac-20342]